MSQGMARPMLPQKPTMLAVPEQIKIDPFNPANYAENIRDSMQKAYNLQKAAVDANERERALIQQENKKRTNEYNQQMAAQNKGSQKYPAKTPPQ